MEFGLNRGRRGDRTEMSGEWKGMDREEERGAKEHCLTHS